MDYKGFNILREKDYPVLSIHSIGPGTLPKALQGVFTSDRVAKTIIDGYVAQRDAEPVVVIVEPKKGASPYLQKIKDEEDAKDAAKAALAKAV